MADGFDGESIMYDILSGIGVSVFQGEAPDNTSGEHIVVGAIVTTSLDVVNDVPLAVNLYVPKTGNGMANRARFKALRTSINSAVAAASMPDGYYCVIKPEFQKFIEDGGKPGFDCYSIRYEITLNK